MNTFDDAKKAKWIVQRIYRNINKEIRILTASLFLENDEDKKYHEFISDWSEEHDNFGELVLFGTRFENSRFGCDFLITEKDIYLLLFKKDCGGYMLNETQISFNIKYDYKTLLFELGNIFDKDKSNKDYYEIIVKKFQ